MHTPPPGNQPQTPGQLEERDVTNLYVWVAVVVLSVVPRTRLVCGQGRQARLVGFTNTDRGCGDH